MPTREAQHATAKEIIPKGYTELVAVSLSADGAFVADQQRSFDLAAPPVELHSAVGAGDSFVAGMTLGLSEVVTSGDHSVWRSLRAWPPS